jgi:hypothetical protein
MTQIDARAARRLTVLRQENTDVYNDMEDG